jgi:hypothetical protein
MSKLTMDEVRSIRTMNYSPSNGTDRNNSLVSPRIAPNDKIRSTMHGFKMLHQEEKSNLSKRFSRVQSTDNVVDALKINFIAAESPRKTDRNEADKFGNSNFSMEVHKSGRSDKKNNLAVDFANSMSK